jgi:hypothetical protein
MHLVVCTLHAKARTLHDGVTERGGWRRELELIFCVSWGALDGVQGQVALRRSQSVVSRAAPTGSAARNKRQDEFNQIFELTHEELLEGTTSLSPLTSSYSWVTL